MLTAVPMENMESNVVSHRLLNKFFFGKSLHFNLEESQKKFMESVSKIHCSNTSDVYGLSIERVSQIKLTFYPIFFWKFYFFSIFDPLSPSKFNLNLTSKLAAQNNQYYIFLVSFLSLLPPSIGA
jgi:hypothetical protein